MEECIHLLDVLDKVGEHIIDTLLLLSLIFSYD